MKKLTILIASLTFTSLATLANAHGFQNNRFGSTIGFSNAFHYTSSLSYLSYFPYLPNLPYPSSHRSSYYPSYSTPYYPTNNLVMDITYRNYQSRFGLRYRVSNGRFSNDQRYNNRTYNNGYHQGYGNGYNFGRRRINRNDYRPGRYNSNTCYEYYYDRFGNRVERRLPASACRP